MQTSDPKPQRGCTFILIIVASCFIGAGIFFYLAGKFIGEEYRHILFFTLLGLTVTIVLGREIIKK